VSKEEVIAAVKECAARLGRAPSLAEVYQITPVSKYQLRKHFGTYTRMLAESGIQRQGPGCRVESNALFLDWMAIVRRLGRIPTMTDYEMEGKYSIRPLLTRSGIWGNVPGRVKGYIVQNGLEDEWKDVLEIIAAHPEGTHRRIRTSATILRTAIQKDKLAGRPIYGKPMFRPFSFAPVNEQGVLFVLGAVAPELGLCITRVQGRFPDVEAMKEIGPNECVRVNYELEYESRNFLEHGHLIDECDGIVCWINNWPDCPVEVIELRRVVEELRNRRERKNLTADERG
jgi:Homing endonuclease associated repeat